jgi:hypothetical protein
MSDPLAAPWLSKEGAMNKSPKAPTHRSGTVATTLHSKIYVAMAGLAVWLVLSVWGFAGGGYADWLLVVVSGFILLVVSLMFVISRVGTHDPGAKAAAAEEGKFGDWVSGEFATWQDKVKGKNAAIEILLPLAAVAFGMSAFAIIYLSVHTS